MLRPEKCHSTGRGVLIPFHLAHSPPCDAHPVGDALQGPFILKHEKQVDSLPSNSRIAVGVAVSASPVGADGKVYCAAEEGDIFVIRAGPVFEVLARNRMGEPCMATPAMVPGRMFIRTVNSLFAVGKQKCVEHGRLSYDERA